MSFLESFLKQHPRLSIAISITVFVIITVPAAIDTYWDLYEKIRGTHVSHVSLGWGVWLGPIIGLILIITVIWKTHSPKLYEVIQGYRDRERRILARSKQEQKVEWDDRRRDHGDNSVPLLSSMKNQNTRLEKTKEDDKKLNSLRAKLRVLIGQIKGPESASLDSTWEDELECRRQEHAREIYVAIALYSYGITGDEQEQLENELKQMKILLRSKEDATNKIISGIEPMESLNRPSIGGATLTEKRLTIRITRESTVDPKDKNIWNYLTVTNGSDSAIEGCYGKLIGFAIEEGRSTGQPIEPPLNLAWSSHHGPTSRITAIGPKESKKLDVLTVDNSGRLHINIPGPTNALRTWFGELSEGEYKLTIQVGSESQNIQPTVIQLLAVYEDNRIQVSELVN